MKQKSLILGLVAGTALTLSAAAYAQPASYTDLGTLTSGTLATGTVNIPGGATKFVWLKFTIPGDASPAAGAYLDIDTNGGTFTGGDTQIALYNSAGTSVANDDESGPSSYSMMSWGVTTPNRPGLAATGNATTVGTAHAGSKGSLTAGTYYLCISGWSTTFNAAFAPSTTHTRTGDVAYRIDYTAATTSPTVAGAITAIAPAASPYINGDTVRFTATVTPGANPSSTGLAVTANLSGVGGSATQTMYDDGTNGDVTIGDNVFSYQTTLSGIAAVNTALPWALSVSDAQSRTGSATPTMSVTTAGTAGMPAVYTDLGNANCVGATNSSAYAAAQVKWFKVTLPAVVAAASSGSWVDIFTSGTGITDTELAVYDNTGVLVTNGWDDDDGPGNYSELSFGQTSPLHPGGPVGGVGANGRDGALAGGTYWIACGAYNLTQGASNWRVTSAATTTGTINLTIGAIDTTCSLPPTGVYSAAPNARLVPGDTVHLGTVVTAGSFPTSTFANPGSGVSVNASGLGAGTVALFDDGLHGDGGAGDLTYGADIVVGAVAPGGYSLGYTITDDQARTGTGSVNTSVAEDLGSLSYGTLVDIDRAFTAGEIKWFRFTVPAAVAAPGNWLDIWTAPSTPVFTSGDTDTAIFDTAGTKIAEADDDGPLNASGFDFYSAYSFGNTTVARSRDGSSGALGANGAFAAGTYWLAVSGYNMTSATGFSVTTTSTATGNVHIKLDYNQPTAPTNPTGVGSATPASGLSGATTHLGVVVTPGLNPNSTFANVGSGVSVDCSTAGAGSVTLFDDGLHGDGGAGDLTYGADVTITAAAAAYTFPFAILDDQARTGSGNISYTVIPSPPTCPSGIESASFTNIASIDPAGDTTPGNVVIPGASLAWTASNMVDKIHVSGRLYEVDTATYASEARFRVTFADSTFVDLQPFTTNSFTNFIDVADYSFDLVPNRSASTIVSIEAFDSYDDSVDGTDSNWSNLCFAYDLACPADVDDGSGTGTSDGGVDINDLLYFLAQYEGGLLPADLDDGSGNGVPDGGVDINDLLYFLFHYETGC